MAGQGVRNKHRPAWAYGELNRAGREEKRDQTVRSCEVKDQKFEFLLEGNGEGSL
jgi:hypothetical protein